MTKQKKAILAVCIISFVLTINSLTSSLAANIRVDYPDVAENTFRLILTIPSLVGLFATFVMGPLSMKVSKKFLTIFCALCMLVYFGTFSLIGPRGPFSLFIIASCLAGICQGGSVTLTSVIIGEYVEQAKRASTMAFSGAILNIGAAGINVVGGIVAAGNEGKNWPMAYYLGAIVIPAVLLFMILMPAKSDSVSGGGGGLAEMAGGGSAQGEGGIPLRVILMAVAALFVSLSFAVFIVYMSEYLVENNIVQSGDSTTAGTAMALFMVAGVAEGFSYPVWQKLFKKFTVFAGYAAIALGLILLLTASSGISVFIAAICIGFGVNLASPYAMTTMMSITPAKMVPIVISLFMGAMNLGIAGAPFVLVPIAQLFGTGIANYILVAVIFASIGSVASILLYGMLKTPAAVPVAEEVAEEVAVTEE